MKRLVLAAALLSLAGAAVADVGPYRWGMSRDQVLAAAGGNAQAVNGTPGQRVFGSDLGAEGEYTAAGIVFRSQFFFDPAGRLSGIKLNARSVGDCPQIRALLDGLYGLGDADGMGAAWTDPQNNNRIRFTQIAGDPCFVAYRPITREGGLGL